jgi:HEAT repeat protein
VSRCIRTLSEWLENLDKEMPNSNYVGTNGAAATAVQQIGTNAIPYLSQMLNARDSRLKTKLITLYVLQGSRCKAAVPILLTALHDIDSEVRRVAAIALQQIDPEAAARAGAR